MNVKARSECFILSKTEKERQLKGLLPIMIVRLVTVLRFHFKGKWNSSSKLKFFFCVFLCCVYSTTAFFHVFLPQRSARYPWILRNNINEFQSKTIETINLSADENNQSELPPRTRRIRYSGLYPRSFQEKYKEHRGDQDVVARVKAKGSTPAGQHIPILLNECMQYMGLSSESIEIGEPEDRNRITIPPLDLSHMHDKEQEFIVIDGTLGFGGHSSEILKRLDTIRQSYSPSTSLSSPPPPSPRPPPAPPTPPSHPCFRLISIDQDHNELMKTKHRMQSLHNEYKAITHNFEHNNFANISTIVEKYGAMGKVSCVLTDLGFSSMQIDDPSRGFSYKVEGPLDMRMNVNVGETAYDLLKKLTKKDLAKLLQAHSDLDADISFAIAKLLVGESAPATTTALADKVRKAVSTHAKDSKLPVPTKDEENSIIARTMQAIRLEVNGELKALDALLQALPNILTKGGRVCILTFHSGEDRRVKKSFKQLFKDGVYSHWGRDVVLASAKERRDNPRSKCCKLRWAIKS